MCIFENCINAKRGNKDLCGSHLMQLKRRGVLSPLRIVNDPEARFWAKVDKSGHHWLWVPGVRDSNGYGQFSIGTRKLYPHRYSYELNVGHIPDGLEIDHKCRVKLCVRPDHLRAVTREINLTNRDDYQIKEDGSRRCCRNHEIIGEKRL